MLPMRVGFKVIKPNLYNFFNQSKRFSITGNKNWFPKASNNMLNRNDLSFINNLDGSATATITVSNKVSFY